MTRSSFDDLELTGERPPWVRNLTGDGTEAVGPPGPIRDIGWSGVSSSWRSGGRRVSSSTAVSDASWKSFRRTAGESASSRTIPRPLIVTERVQIFIGELVCFRGGGK